MIWRNPVNNNAFPIACSDRVEKQVSRKADRGQNVIPVADMLHTGKQETSQHHTPDRQVPTLAQVQRGNHRLPLLLFLDDLPLKILWHGTTEQNCEAYCVMQNWSPKWLHQLQWCQQSRERPPTMHPPSWHGTPYQWGAVQPQSLYSWFLQFDFIAPLTKSLCLYSLNVGWTWDLL